MTVDTNIVIAYLAGESRVVDFVKEFSKSGQSLLLPTVVETEVLSFPAWTLSEREDTERFLEENFTSISFDRAIARVAAQIRGKTKIKIPDAAIAATAIATNTALATRNIDDFQRVSELRLVSI